MKVRLFFDRHRTYVGLTWLKNQANYTNDSGRDPDGVYRGNDWSAKWDERWSIWINLVPCLTVEIKWTRYDLGRHYTRARKTIVNTPHPEHGHLRSLAQVVNAKDVK